MDTAFSSTKAALSKSLGKAEEEKPKHNNAERAAEIAEAADLSSLADLIDDGLPQALERVSQDAGGSFIANVTTGAGQDMFDLVDERAVAFANDRAGDLVTGITDTTRSEIQRIVAEGLAENLSTADIAEQLQSAYTFSDARAALIANTEVANANSQGALIGMRAAADAGLGIKKKWIADAIACDICLLNEAEGPIDLEDIFPSGDSAAPAHPNCRCVLASEIDPNPKD